MCMLVLALMGPLDPVKFQSVNRCCCCCCCCCCRPLCPVLLHGSGP